MNPNFVIEPTHVVQRQLWEISATGPASYNQATGDVINFQATQFPSAIPGGFLTQSRLYELKPFPSITANLRPTWAFQWSYSGGGGSIGVGSLAFTAGSGQTNGTYNITANSGTAVAQIVIAGGAITSATLISPGSYTIGGAAPTFTVAEGGTPGTVTATLATPGQEVPTGANLSGEQVQFFVIGGEM